MRFGLSVFGFLALIIVGCVPQPAPVHAITLSEHTNDAVVRLMRPMIPLLPPADTTVLVATAASLARPEIRQTTNFGRLLSEQIAAHLAQIGYRVPEVRLAGAVMFKDGGEF